MWGKGVRWVKVSPPYIFSGINPPPHICHEPSTANFFRTSTYFLLDPLVWLSLVLEIKLSKSRKLKALKFLYYFGPNQHTPPHMFYFCQGPSPHIFIFGFIPSPPFRIQNKIFWCCLVQRLMRKDDPSFWVLGAVLNKCGHEWITKND